MRGATNAVADLPPGCTSVCTASAGNFAQGLAWACRSRKPPVSCTAVVPDHAPRNKIEAIQRLGAHVKMVPFPEWWRIIETGDCSSIVAGQFVHPCTDQRVMAGNGTIGLEIAEDLDDVSAVLVPYGGGALACGVAAGVKQQHPGCRVYGCEPSTAAPLASSFRSQRPVSVDYEPSFIDGCGGKTVLPAVWQLASGVLDGGLTATPDEAARAVKLLLERNRVVAEGAGAVGVAIAMSGAAGRSGKVSLVDETGQ